MPARGASAHLGESKAKQERRAREEAREERAPGGAGESLGAPGVSSIAQAHKRGLGGDVDEYEDEAGEPRKRNRKKKEEIVTVTRRQDAEPLNKRPITMKEIFPKEFWRV